MKRADHHLNLAETPIIADRILRNYKRDRSFFEHYSPKFNNEFLVHFEEKVDRLFHLTPLQVLEKEVAEKTEKILIVINHIRPLVNITEVLLLKAAYEPGLSDVNLSINQLRESLNKKSVWEIQRNCRRIVNQLEFHIEELIDKGFILRILDDYYLLIGKLKKCEIELADVTHRRDMIANEYLMVNTQLKDVVETIIESIPDALGENNTDKRDEYSIEKLMIQAQFRRSESH